jgi:hypothetical protein
MVGASGSAGGVGTSLSAPSAGGSRARRYQPIVDSATVAERLDASLVPADRSLFEVALRRSLSNWTFHVPSTVAVLWLSTVIVDLAVMLSALLGALVVIVLVPAMVTVGLAAPRVLFRPLTARGRAGYLWFLGTTAVGVLDCAVYGTCIFLLARAAQFPLRSPF